MSAILFPFVPKFESARLSATLAVPRRTLCIQGLQQQASQIRSSTAVRPPPIAAFGIVITSNRQLPRIQPSAEYSHAFQVVTAVGAVAGAAVGALGAPSSEGAVSGARLVDSSRRARRNEGG